MEGQGGKESRYSYFRERAGALELSMSRRESRDLFSEL